MQPIIVDVETAPHPCAPDFVPAPDFAAIKPDARLKDPDKIAADILLRQAKAAQEHADTLARTSLDWNLCRIVSLAWTTDGGVTIQGDVCRHEANEADVIMAFWHDVETRVSTDGWWGTKIIGFCARTFDLPVIIQRSRLLNLEFPHISLARYGKGHVLDLHDTLTFDDARYAAIMPRSLTMFCRRFGIPVDDPIAGDQIPGLVASEDWPRIWDHNASDVRVTAQLAQRLRLKELASAPVF